MKERKKEREEGRKKRVKVIWKERKKVRKE